MSDYHTPKPGERPRPVGASRGPIVRLTGGRFDGALVKWPSDLARSAELPALGLHPLPYNPGENLLGMPITRVYVYKEVGFLHPDVLQVMRLYVPSDYTADQIEEAATQIAALGRDANGDET